LDDGVTTTAASGKGLPNQHRQNACHDTFPETTQTVPEINRIVATPLVASVIVALSLSVPAM
jgi:hypothetical protein